MKEWTNNPFSLSGKVALITGGGTGLGFAMARCMIEAGAKVVIIGRRENVLAKACDELGESADFLVFDVADTDQASALIAQIVQKHGSIDILVNNAGVHSKKPWHETTASDLDLLFGIHVQGAFALSKAVVPYMEKSGSGSIIMISSESALVGLTNVVAYASAKASLLGLTKSLTADLSPKGIRVNALIPGFIDTPMFRKATDADPERKAKILGHTPMKRFGDPMDIGWAAVYLASPAASFVTGLELVVDGGFRIGF